MPGFVPLFQNMGLEFAIMSYGGRLSICAAAEPNLVPDADALADHLQAAFAELSAALTVAEARPMASDSPYVGNLMTADPITLVPTDTLADAYAIMRQRSIRHLPVVGADGRLVGIVTHRDLLAAAPSSLDARAESDRIRVLEWARAADVMETHVSVARPDEAALDAGERMIRHKIGCQPVVDGAGRLVGILTEEDLVCWATARMGRTGAVARASV